MFNDFGGTSMEDMPEDDIGGPVSIEQAQVAQKALDARFGKNVAKPVFQENCPKCGGDGRYHAPSSLGHQICTKCDGKGKVFYKKPKAERLIAKEKAAARKVKKANDDLAAFESQYPTLALWWTGSDFGFAVSMREAVRKYGKLTPGQLAASIRCVEKFEAAKAARAVAQAAVVAHVATLPVLDISHITSAFERARDAGIKRPKLRLFSGIGSYEFSRAPDTGRNPGAVYVNDDRGAYLGMVTQGKFRKSRDCDAGNEQEVMKVCTDPAQAAIAYGKKFGCCSVCNRELSDPVSVERGIGPICADRFFG
jgi:hypothetical protein